MAELYVSIGNSDDKLTQQEWSLYVAAVDNVVRAFAVEVHGQWLSEPSSAYQNACWACVIRAGTGDVFRDALGREASRFRQDSIAVAEAVTEFVPGRTALRPCRGPYCEACGDCAHCYAEDECMRSPDGKHHA